MEHERSEKELRRCCTTYVREGRTTEIRLWKICIRALVKVQRGTQANDASNDNGGGG